MRWIWVVTCALVALGCDQERKAPPAPRARSVAVQGSGSAAPSTPAPPPRAIAKRKGPLCGGKLNAEGRELPASELAHESVAGVPAPPAKLQVGEGKWTWINFWAAWCEPCKEEIPRLKSWESRLNAAGIPIRVQFISLDDDPRQLRRFLTGQGADGLRSTYWLREGDEREAWLTDAGAGADPELPIHLVVDPKGMIRCVLPGAVEDGDYPTVVELLKK